MSRWIRQSHRWVSIAFTVTVIVNIVVMSVGQGLPPAWVTYSPLLPLALLMFTGLYLLALPHATRPTPRVTEDSGGAPSQAVDAR